MNFKKLFLSFISLGSIYYTIMSFAILVVTHVITTENSNPIIETGQFLNLLLFAFIMSLGSALKQTSSFYLPIRYALHALCFVGGFLLFVLVGGIEFSKAIIATVIFAALYILAQVITNLIKNGNRSKKVTSPTIKKTPSKKQKNTEYTSMFSSNTKEDGK